MLPYVLADQARLKPTVFHPRIARKDLAALGPAPGRAILPKIPPNFIYPYTSSKIVSKDLTSLKYSICTPIGAASPT